MRLIVTGGGTGGHVYPALEVGRAASVQGANLRYYGSRRGQEGRACEVLGVPFKSFGSVPLHSLKTPKGWRALASLMRASLKATKALKSDPADVVFSTGGYSAAPILWAARRTGTPYILFEANSMPGRTTRMFVPGSAAQAYVFRSTKHMDPAHSQRTGLPIRKALRDATAHRAPEENLVLVIGGSQGSTYLNEKLPRVARELSNVRFVHATGKKHIQAVHQKVAKMNMGDRYHITPYLEEADLLDIMSRCTLAVARSGGTLSELAAFGIPSVLVPLPSSADNHQKINAREFVDMNAATLCEQSSDNLAEQIGYWLGNADARNQATAALREWDMPDATDRIVKMLFEAAR